ncbi:T9SS type A sorting domain-containing protein [candidate division KSB1 bacterium]|nr:T9SS type A sorting domain-containing protein [candidate division KSB1 bacterium]
MLDNAADLPSILPVNPITAISENKNIPIAFSLNHFPNPFNSILNIEFSIEKETEISLVVFDITGRLIELISTGRYQIGHYYAQWNASNYSSGLYLIRLNSPDFNITRKAVFLK